ncbi:Casein kinase II subunit alpha [Tetrabaena socialis]|uniref:non-specific serine/threonine protein kinase n=1 Tax=Tetrabaena socialis TaxID=47790 RepID=A0A2J8AEL4_9CHLO|nr:Casein kinase II subunit alpha [Tetrabaena socialis]|eukprot:PNH10954.1 Casein kinase II subunit alpha [Tetrabaena socialis]
MAPPKRYPKSSRRKDSLRVVARDHATALLRKPTAYYDDTLNVTWGSQDQYEVFRQLGKGKYGEVYEGVNLRLAARDKDRVCVIKVMRPVKEHRLRREVKILQHVSGGPNIVRLLDIVRDPDTKTPSFVFDFVDAMPFKELQASVSDLDVRYYILQLLIALDYCHSHGIMHRDVKVDAALGSLVSVSEPFIARCLARSLPAGHGLFIGNSMPIRDTDMYACPRGTAEPSVGTQAEAEAAGQQQGREQQGGEQQGQEGDGEAGDDGDGGGPSRGPAAPSRPPVAAPAAVQEAMAMA